MTTCRDVDEMDYTEWIICPKCKNEVLIEIEGMKVKIVKEPDAKTQSQ